MSWNYDMNAAPKDGTLLQLLIDIEVQDGFEDNNPSRTIGFNNFTNDDQDEWKFPGWSWIHDYITEQGSGKPIAWALMLELPTEQIDQK